MGNSKWKSILESKEIYDWFVLETQKGNLPNFFDTFGFFRDENGVYHAKQDGWQSTKVIGYNDLYDVVFDAGTSMDRKKFEFSVGDQHFIIWLWKGDYLNLGAGAEAGIYYGGGPHWLTGVDYAMPMTLAVYDNQGNEILNWKPGEDNWWITGFNPNYQEVKASNLNVYGSINFSEHLDMWESFYRSIDGDPTWILDPVRFIAKFKW